MQGKTVQMKKKMLWEFATAPKNHIFMHLFLLWMVGNDINIFTIMFTGQVIYSSVSAILGVSHAFEQIIDSSERDGELRDEVFNAQITYLGFQLATLAIGLYKCYNLGLVPTNAVDWVDHRVRHPAEFAFGA
eukprot:Sspe_Gene.111470::Locus_93557_Transcript_1_1_Confidence_1.000_Length_499::g.111470::m.111470